MPATSPTCNGAVTAASKTISAVAWFYPVPPSAMRFIRFLLGKKKKYTRWLYQAGHGENRVRIGQDSDGKDFVFVVQFAKRGKYGIWKELGRFPFMETSDFMKLLIEAGKKIEMSAVGV